MLRSNIKQRDLADRLGMSEVSVSRYVHGQRMPKGNILVEMARVLNTTPEYLTGTEGLDHPDIAFAKARIMIRTYGNQWNYEQQKELINMMLDVIKE